MALALTLTVLYAPIAQLLVSSFNRNSLTASWKGFTTRWYSQALDNEQVVDAAARSLRLALVVSFAAAIIGGLAVLVVRRHPKWSALVRSFAAARLAVPEIVLAVALGVVLPLFDVRPGAPAMWFGHTVFLSGYVVLVVGARLADLDPSLEDAAADLGARPLGVLRHVVVPHMIPALLASTVLVAAFSFDDVLLSNRLGGPQDTTLPVVIVSMATRRPTPELDAIGSLVVLAGVGAFIVSLLVSRLRGGFARDLVAGANVGT